MAKSRGGLISLIIGIVAVLAGVGFVIASVLPIMDQFQPVLTMQSPDAAEVKIATPGTYTLWHDHKTTYEGAAVDHEESLPGGFNYALRRMGEEERIELEELPAKARASMQLQSREAVAIGTFQVDAAGPYTLDVRNPADDARVFSLTEGSFLGSMAKFGLRLVIGLVLGGGGLVLLILGIVFMVRGPKAKPAAPPTTPPPPIPG